MSAKMPTATSEPITAPAAANNTLSKANIANILFFVPPTSASLAAYARLSLTPDVNTSATPAIQSRATAAPAMVTGADKLRAKGVASVPSRIGLLKDHLSIGIAAFKRHVREHLCGRSITLDETDAEGIRTIEQAYRSPAFLYGSNPSCDFTRKLRIDTCGTVEAHINVRHGRIRTVDFAGDFFVLADLTPLRTALTGVPFQEEAIRRAAKAVVPERFIRHFGTDDLVRLLLDKTQPTP